MVTYSLRRAKPQVRFLAPHPFFVFLAILLLSCSAMAADQQSQYSDIDYYAAAPDTLAVALSSSDSLARAGLFGVNWYYSPILNAVSSVNGVDMTGRADGVQELATATYRTFQGVDSALSALSVDSSWLEKIYDLLYESRRSGDVVEKVSIPQLLREFHTDDRTFWNNYVNDKYNGFYYNFSTGTTSILRRESVPNLLAALNTSILGFGRTESWLSASGKDVSTMGVLTDVIGGGFQGLATLLAGPSDHRENEYVWLNQSGYAANGSTSLMDMVGEGFLGFSSLFSDADPGEARLSWMYVSPDDGVAGQQVSYSTLFSFLGSFASGVQNPLARLAYVLADLEDIEFKKEEKPNMDAVKDSFFGDGEGAVNPDQIKDAAGISSAAKDAFGGAGSPGDAFTAINDSQSFWFFSQEVADALDTVNAAALASEDADDFMDQFVQDEDGFYSLVDLSPWDVSSYLGG